MLLFENVQLGDYVLNFSNIRHTIFNTRIHAFVQKRIKFNYEWISGPNIPCEHLPPMNSEYLVLIYLSEIHYTRFYSDELW